MYLEEATCQAESLASKSQELEMELFKEKEERKRLLFLLTHFRVF